MSLPSKSSQYRKKLSRRRKIKIPATSYCYKCKKTKSSKNFVKDRTRKSGLNNLCRECARDKSLMGKYGIGSKEFDPILRKQGGECAVCGDKEPGGIGWVVDHDHATGKIRGILCDLCNRGLGFFRDSNSSFDGAKIYLGFCK